MLSTQSVLRNKAVAVASERLKLATTLAATVGGSEIDRRWRILETEAMQPELVSAILAT